MRRRALLGVLATGGLAGCLRLEGGAGTASSTRTERTTRTTTASGDDSTSTMRTSRSTEEEDAETTNRPEEASYPAGLSDDGVNQFLFSSHTRALTDTSCRLSWRKLNYTAGDIEEDKIYDVDSGVASGEWTASEGGTVEMFREGSRGLWREGFGDGYTYGEDAFGFAWRRVSWGVEVNPQLTAWEWEAPERVNDGRPAVWEVSATRVADASTPPGYHVGTVQSLEEASMRVNEDGVILALEAKYTIENGENGQKITYESTFGTRAIGDVSVSEPSWLSTAANRVPVASARYANNRRVVEFTLESGGPLVADSRIVLVPPGGPPERRKADISNPIEPGKTVSLWHDESDSYRRLRLSQDGLPASASPVQLGDSHDVFLYNGARLYAPKVPVQ